MSSSFKMITPTPLQISEMKNAAALNAKLLLVIAERCSG